MAHDHELTDDEILESMRPETRAMFDRVTDPKEKARMWQGAKKRLLAKRLSESPPQAPRQDHPDTWLYFDRLSGSGTLHKHNPNEENEKREADARTMREAFADALREVESEKETQRQMEGVWRQAGFIPVHELPSPASADQKPGTFFSVMWDELKKHRGWYLLAFFVGGLPVGFATVYQILTHDTLPEWLAKHGGPRVITLVAAWVVIALIIATVIVIRSYLSVRDKDRRPKPPLPRK